MARINGYRPSRRFLVAVLAGGGSLSAWGCSNDAWVASADIEVPGRSWTQVTPAEAGFDADELEALAQKSDDGTTNCVAITRNGRLVEDWYFHGTDENSAQEVFSATKSVTSTLIGIAQGDGLLDIDDPASKYIPEWTSGVPAEIRVKDLLSNDSGRHYSQAEDIKMATQIDDQTEFAIDLPQDEPPGQVWAYNNSAIQTLSQVLEISVDSDPIGWAEDRLFGPIGMSESKMTADNRGNMRTYLGLQSTCLDLARFGVLALNLGAWDDAQIVSAEWMREATRPSQDLEVSYGYLWWLNSAHSGSSADVATGTAAPDDEGEQKPVNDRLIPEASTEVFMALGLGNQMVIVVPSQGIVAVRLGSSHPSDFNQAVFANGVLDALVP